MGRFAVTLALLSVFGLGGCAISTPFQGPGYDRRDGVTVDGEGRLVVAVTKAVLRDDGARRATFWDYVFEVEASLPERPGFVGYSLRRELLGKQAWTMTVWTDEASLAAFVESDIHQAAIREALGALACARFARLEVARDEVPVAWDRALALFEAQAAPCG
ncbi:MAG: antibiotic biosynthesis monooxygenase [Kiloniellales bacterium]|nr:antibiotic biosynthesis monooxygenase [Kiloniellales bacterium]